MQAGPSRASNQSGPNSRYCNALFCTIKQYLHAINFVEKQYMVNKVLRYPLNQNMLCLYKSLMKPSYVKLSLDTSIAQRHVSDTLVCTHKI
jgi:hypothetical protein